MTLTMSRVLAWRCDEVVDAADRLRGWSRDVDWLTVDFRRGTDLSACWEGAAGVAAQAQADRVATDIKQLEDILAESAQRVGAAGDALVDAQRRLRAALTRAEAIGVTIFDDGSTRLPPFVAPDTDDVLAIARAEASYAERVLEARLIEREAQEALAAATQADADVRDGFLKPLLESRAAAPRGWVMDEALLLSTGSYGPTVDAARKALANLIAHPGDDRERLEVLASSLEDMTPDELEEFFASLDAGELASLQHFLTQRKDDGGWPWARWHDGLSDDDRNTLLNHIKLTLDLDTLKDLRDKLPVLETDQYLDSYNTKKSPPLVWRDLTAPAFHTDGPPIDLMHDVDQGADGDCWFLTSLNAVARAHPEVLTQHLHHNSNGTYTVDFYVNKHWIPVTVLPDVPHQEGTSNPYYAQEGFRGTQVSWAPIYEKAYAQLRAGYEEINGGWPGNALPNIIGPSADIHSFEAKDVDDSDFVLLKQDLTAGYAVTADTKGVSDKTFLDPASTIVADHAYCVLDIDTLRKTVTLLNPWGANSARIQEITISYTDFRTYYQDVAFTKVAT